MPTTKSLPYMQFFTGFPTNLATFYGIAGHKRYKKNVAKEFPSFKKVSKIPYWQRFLRFNLLKFRFLGVENPRVEIFEFKNLCLGLFLSSANFQRNFSKFKFAVKISGHVTFAYFCIPAYSK